MMKKIVDENKPGYRVDFISSWYFRVIIQTIAFCVIVW